MILARLLLLVVLPQVLSCASSKPHWAGERLTPGSVGAVMMSRMGAVGKCYDAEHKKNPELAGKVLIEFTLGADGRVGTADLAEYDEPLKEVGLCIVRDAYNWSFPPPRSGTAMLTYPFIFRPRRER